MDNTIFFLNEQHGPHQKTRVNSDAREE